jgi:hypothetical protein
MIESSMFYGIVVGIMVAINIIYYLFKKKLL